VTKNVAKGASKKRSPRAAKPACIELGERLTIVQATELHGTLTERLAGGKPIVVDGARVEEIDTAILQLLASLWRTCLQRGIGCTWAGTSEVLRRTAALVGLAEILQLTDDESAPSLDAAG
jgi:anti-anti-sigma regulatory factor